MRLKKLILTTGSIALGLAPIGFVVSCGGENDYKPDPPKQYRYTYNLSLWFTPYNKADLENYEDYAIQNIVFKDNVLYTPNDIYNSIYTTHYKEKTPVGYFSKTIKKAIDISYLWFHSDIKNLNEKIDNNYGNGNISENEYTLAVKKWKVIDSQV